MQFLKVANELITDLNITSNEFRIYTYLLSLYNSEKQCAYPSMETISEKIGIGKSTIKLAIKKLVKLGYMTIEKKKGINGNFNTYKEFKHLIPNDVKVTTKSESEVKAEVEEVKTVKPSTTKNVVAPAKEEVVEISEFSREHQSKIALVMKQGVKLTKKQQWLIGDMDLEMLRQAIFRFRKATKTNTFAFLLECYFTECSLNDVEISMDLQRYTGNIIVPVSEEYLENERVKALMIEEGIFDEEEWNNNIALGL